MTHRSDGIASDEYEITEEDIKKFVVSYRKIVPRDKRTLPELRHFIIDELIRERLRTA
jgi:hypothetical protein